jgi:hypothetical protein
MTVPASSAPLLPDRSLRVMVPWSDGDHVMVVDEPAEMEPPVGEVMALDWAATRAPKAATAVAKSEVKRIVSTCCAEGCRSRVDRCFPFLGCEWFLAPWNWNARR